MRDRKEREIKRDKGYEKRRNISFLGTADDFLEALEQSLAHWVLALSEFEQLAFSEFVPHVPGRIPSYLPQVSRSVPPHDLHLRGAWLLLRLAVLEHDMLALLVVTPVVRGMVVGV